MARPISQNSLYRKIEQDLRHGIEQGQWVAGSRLPDECTLAERYSVSRTTIRQALSRLQEQSLIDRIPGHQGLYVSDQIRPSRYLHLIVRAYHPSWLGYYTSCIVSQAEQSARRAGWRFCFHQVLEMNQARQVIDEINRDPMTAGGLLEGRFTSDDVMSLTDSSGVPWVILSDLFEPIRTEPVLNQVICDPFSSIQQASRCLVESGCVHPSLFVFDRQVLWSQEAISAYRSVFDAAGLPVDRQQIFDLSALRSNQFIRTSPSDNMLANVQAMHRVFSYWKQTQRWPDGMILPGHDIRTLELAVGQDAQACHHLRNLKLILTGSDETYEIFGHRSQPWPTRWVLASVAKMTDMAVSLMKDQRQSSDGPRRKYLRDVRVVEESAMPVMEQEHSHESAGLVIV